MRSLLIAAGALFALALGAQADSITLSAEASGTVGGSPIHGPPQIWTADLPQFDPALGTLNSIDLSVDGWHTGTFTFSNTEGGAKEVQVRWIDFSFEINGFGETGGNLLFEPWVFTPTPAKPFGAAPGHWNLPWTDVLAGQTLGPLPFGTQLHTTRAYQPGDAHFDAFVGTGTLPFEIRDWAVYSVSWYGNGGENMWALDSNCGVHVEVTYNYAVPEPAALALLSVVGLLLRRR